MSTLPHDTSKIAGTAPLIARGTSGQEFDAIVREFVDAADEVGMGRPSEAELRELCRRVEEATHGVFSGSVRLRVGRDREIPDDIYFLVDACTPQDPDEFVARANDWHLAVHEAAGT